MYTILTMNCKLFYNSKAVNSHDKFYTIIQFVLSARSDDRGS